MPAKKAFEQQIAALDALREASEHERALTRFATR
jgi:hypothetical protein